MQALELMKTRLALNLVSRCDRIGDIHADLARVTLICLNSHGCFAAQLGEPALVTMAAQNALCELVLTSSTRSAADVMIVATFQLTVIVVSCLAEFPGESDALQVFDHLEKSQALVYRWADAYAALQNLPTIPLASIIHLRQQLATGLLNV